jgi:hypothetical protein
VILTNNISDLYLRNKVNRIILSLLQVHKVLSIPTAPSLQSITAKFKGESSAATFISFKEAFLTLGLDLGAIRSSFQKACQSQKFHESMSSGPNGHAI